MTNGVAWAKRSLPMGLEDDLESRGFVIAERTGRPEQVIGSQGEVLWEATYDAYGAATVSAATLDMPLRYPGQVDDGEGYGVYNWHRSYIPELGIYTSLDPLLQDHGALYGYAGANPMWFVDPEGLEYADLNCNFGFLNFGIQYDFDSGIYYEYVGFSTNISFSISVTFSPQNASEGWYAAMSYATSELPAVGQVGIGYDTNAGKVSAFAEGGGILPIGGQSASVISVREMTPPGISIPPKLHSYGMY